MIEACTRVAVAKSTGNDPNPEDVKACNAYKNAIEALAEILARKFIPKDWPIPPGPGPYRPYWGDYSISTGQLGAEVITEMVLEKMRGSSAMKLGIFDEVIKSGAHLDVAKNLINDFEDAATQLRLEIQAWKKR
ncbi:MAG: hypothetical protein GY777_29450 [Candidatus Brocadiaceae bacterium]|nr:hypothetical protein [Candidatus Brocadiaceae bacterium]